MTTGSGKSLTMALLIEKMQVRTLVIVPNLELKRQLTESFKSWFGTTSNLVVENIDSNKLNKLTDFDMLIVDEAHHSSSATYRRLNRTAWKNIYHRYFFTATFFRNKENEALLLEGITGQLCYKLTYKEAVKTGAVVPIEAYYIEMPKRKTDAYAWAEVYSELVVNNKSRNEIIANLLESLEAAGKSTLCLVKEVKHGEKIQEATQNSNIPFAHGTSDDHQRLISDFNKGKIKSLIGTVGICGEGIDTKPAEYAIIAGLGKAKSAFMQNVGRVLRRYEGKDTGKVIIFKDSSHKFALRHFKEQCKILKDEYGITPQKLEL